MLSSLAVVCLWVEVEIRQYLSELVSLGSQYVRDPSCLSSVLLSSDSMRQIKGLRPILIAVLPEAWLAMPQRDSEEHFVDLLGSREYHLRRIVLEMKNDRSIQLQLRQWSGTSSESVAKRGKLVGSTSQRA